MTGERTVLAVSVLVALAGVSGAQAPSVASLPEVLDAPAAEAAQPIARRRDPFRPFTLDIRPSEARVQLSPLQRYELGQLTVVGTVWAVSPPRAMLEDSSGMGFIVTIGTLIGPNGGQVTAIEPERVVIEEHVTDFYGREQVNRVVMETPKEEPTTQTARERR